LSGSILRDGYIGNTIVAGNIATSGAGSEIQLNNGTITSVGNNLVGDSVGDSTNTGLAIAYHPTDFRDVNPMLGALQNNGGKTPTHALLVGSPAIDKGNRFGATTDQRGFVRPIDDSAIANNGDGSDIGAFELGPTSSAPTTTGQNVSVAPTSNLNMTFGNVSTAGNTTVTALTQSQIAPLPSNFSLIGSPIMYDITTTAVFSGNIKVTFNVPNIASATACSQLRILHYINNSWDISGNATPSYDSATGVCTVSQTVSSLSPFVVVQINAAPSYEGDVDPRETNGNQLIQSGDVVQMRRFLNRSDTPNASTNEFQRADSSPFNPATGTFGDGFIRSDDVVQTRRYQNRSDPMQPAAGPTGPPSMSDQAMSDQAMVESGGGGGESASGAAAPGNHRRHLQVQNASGSAGTTVTVNILVDSVGDEAGYGFTINYDQNVLTAPVVRIGAAGGTRSCNTRTTPGQIFCGVDTFPTNRTGEEQIGEIAPGDAVVLVSVTFTISGTAAPNTTTAVTLTEVNASDDTPPLALEISSQGGTVTITGPTAATVSISGRVTAKRRGVSGAVVQITKQTGEIQTARTNRFGYYTFKELAVGETYIFNVFSKRFQFNTQVINLTEDLSDIDFTAQ
jgi:hypothetical protein